MPSGLKAIVLVACIIGLSAGAWAIITDLTIVDAVHDPQAEHVDQEELYDLVAAGEDEQAFEEAFEHGDELFETEFNALDGVGANVGQGQRFTRVPRADLNGTGEWANHVPARATGPNATSCNSCHNAPFDDGGGGVPSNVHRDPLHSGVLSKFIQRNTPHAFGLGGLQRLAEEMTDKLLQIKDQAKSQACSQGSSTKDLVAKGISYGKIKATRTQNNPCVVSFDTSLVKGVGTDLVVRPFQWKGNFAFIREFNRDASHNELGMQAVEIAGDNVDGDSDGVANEMTIGDQTSLAIYLAYQPRPTSKIELAALGLIDPLSSEELQSIAKGAVKFVSAGCATCHVPVLKIDNPIYTEPSQNPNYRDATFPAGQDPKQSGVDPALAVKADLSKDHPDNIIKDENGNVIFRLGSFRKDNNGKTLVELFGDLKRHDMGPGLAEGIDEAGTGASSFMTENLWGCGSTGPYMHDGRATTITEAILEHGGEAKASRDSFVALSTQSKKDLSTFLESLVLFKMEEE
jgi:cytochrome c peroxidase